MYLNLFLDARNKLVLSNNDFIFLMNIQNITESQGVEWYTAYEGMSEQQFLGTLARYVNTKFTAQGVEKLMKRLALRGLIEIDMPSQLRIRVTEKFTNALNENKAKVNAVSAAKKGSATSPTAAPTNLHAVKKFTPVTVSIEEQQAANEIDDFFAKCWLAATNDIAEYRQNLETFVAKVEEVGDTVKLTELQQKFLKGLAKILYPTAEEKPIADKVIETLHKNQRAEYGKLMDNYKLFSSWEIDVEMTEKDYLNRLNSTVLWLTQAQKYKVVTLTDADKSRLEFAQKCVGRYKNDPNAQTDWAFQVFRQRKTALLEKAKQQKTEKEAKPNEKLAEMLKTVGTRI